MDYLTNYYKNRCEELTEKANYLQFIINEMDQNSAQDTGSGSQSGGSGNDQTSDEPAEGPPTSTPEPGDPEQKFDPDDAKKYQDFDEWMRNHPQPIRRNYPNEDSYRRALSSWLKMRDTAHEYYKYHPSKGKIDAIRKEQYNRFKLWLIPPVIEYWKGRLNPFTDHPAWPKWNKKDWEDIWNVR